VLRLTLCFIGILGAAVAGCDRPASPTPAPATSKPVAPPVEQIAAAVAPKDGSVDEAVNEPEDGKSDTPNDDTLNNDTQETQKPAANDAKPAVPAGRERVALLTPGGPLIVDFWITIDGRSHTSPFDELVTKVLEASGETKDGGRATWEALAANEEFLESQQPNGPSGASQLKMWIEQYDSNRDGHIQRSEAAAWLGRNAGRTASAFAVRSSRSYVSAPSASSRVWRLLDKDQDGLLSVEEIDSAAGTFWTFDANDDRVISSTELATLREQLEATGMPMAVRDEVARYAAIHIEPDIDADRLEYLLGDLYATRQLLGPSSFTQLAESYKKLDANGDDWLEQLELTDMVTMDAHLELSVAFGAADAAQNHGPVLAVRGHVPDVEILATPSSNRIVISAGNARLIISAHDLAGGNAGNPGAAPEQMRLMVHDQSDAVFEELDRNADGRLGEREITAATSQLLVRDANSDGALAANELRYSMIVAFLRGEPQQEQSFYVPPSLMAASTDNAPAWFVSADFNADGDISRREFVGSFERFATVDANQDGYISREEATEFDKKAREDSDG
jgi:Ca2+-binding EF-hand superfamily protein